MYPIKSLYIFIFAFIFGFLPLSAKQYEKQSEKSKKQNVDFSTFSKHSKRLFNFSWRFCLGNPDGAYFKDFDDSSWRDVDLPHDFQFEQPWNEECGGARGFKPMCEGWYRKKFFIDGSLEGKEILLDFGGIMYYADVYINGQKVASSEYGYIGFEVEISKYLEFGKENVVAVYANSGKINGSRWYTGAGLFRDVYLKIQNPTHIARHGIFVTTPNINDKEAQVQVQVDVCGFKKHKTQVKAFILDNEGRVVVEANDTMNLLTKHSHDEKVLPLMKISYPKLWDLDSPYLYTVSVELWADSILVDNKTEKFGIRKLEYSKDFGFKLNGKKVFLKGVANHHDLGALGAAAFDRAIERQLKQMKDFGFNSIRCSHNPYSESLTKLADSLGILVVDEFIDKWSDDEYWGGRKPFMDIWSDLLEEFIKRDRNSPSVILWSLGNELQVKDSWNGYKTNDWGITTYKIFNVLVKRYDATRPTTVAQFPARAGGIRQEKEFSTYFAPPELGCATEVASFNYQWDCYSHYFEYDPNLILYQSEAVTNQLLAPFYGMDQNRTVGLAYWGPIEYWGESDGWPKKGWNYSFFSHTLQPYPQAYLIKGAFKPEEPIVRIGVLIGQESLSWNDVYVGQKVYTSFWNNKDGSSLEITTFTNAEEVELQVNGESLGRQKNDTLDVYKRGIISWNEVPYGKGGKLTAIAYNDGKEVARHEIETASKAKELRVEVETPNSWRADGMDLQYINVYAVDEKGRRVPTFDESLTVTVSGSATFLAMDNADHYTNDLFYNVTTKKMRQGYMQIILRSKKEKGSVKVNLSCPSLKKQVNLKTK